MAKRTSLTVALLSILSGLAACDDPAALDPCGSSESITPYGMSIEAHLTSVLRSDSGEIFTETEDLDCVEYVLAQPDSDWSRYGTAPDEVDVAPDLYTLQFSHTDADGVRYTSELLTIDHEGGEVVDAPLCADISGGWTCESGSDTLAVEVAMDGCRATFEGLSFAEAEVDGQCLMDGDGHELIGVLEEAGQRLTLPQADELQSPVSCWRD